MNSYPNIGCQLTGWVCVVSSFKSRCRVAITCCDIERMLWHVVHCAVVVHCVAQQHCRFLLQYVIILFQPHAQ